MHDNEVREKFRKLVQQLTVKRNRSGEALTVVVSEENGGKEWRVTSSMR